MKKLLSAIAIWAALLTPVSAANVNIDALPAAASVGGTDLLECEQGGINRKCTAAQTAAYINSLFSGDATAAAGGAVTFATVNANVGSFGSTTNCTTITVNAKGLITAASQAACALPFTAVTGRATLAQLPQGIANSIWINPTGSTADMQNLAVPACANDGVHALVYVNGSGLACSALTTGGAGTVTSVTPGAGLVSGVTASCTQTAITTSGTLSEASCLNAQTGTTYTVLDTDRAKLVTISNAAAIAVTVPQAGAASAFANGWRGTFSNIGTGTATFTPTTSTINGAATYRLFAGQSITIVSDGTNYQIDPGTTGGVTISLQSGANYPFVASDFAKAVYLSNGSNQIPTIAVASALGANWYVNACNIGAGTQTITPTTSTIGGAATFILPAASAARPACVTIVSDGTNYSVAPFFPMDASMFSAGTLAAGRMPALTGDVTTSAGSVATTLAAGSASNLNSGTLAAARGGAGTITGALKGSGAGVVTQAACADLSNGATGCSTATGTSGGTLPLLNGTNTWSGTQTFGSVVGTITSQSGTTYTLVAADCGTMVRFTNAAAVTVTIPQGLAVGCNIAIEQTTAAGQVSVNGSAVTPATLHSAHSYTKTFGQWAIIGISIESSNVAILTGDGA